MTLQEYMREIILMERQYGQEEELYPLINMLLRKNTKGIDELSIRTVACTKQNWKQKSEYPSSESKQILPKVINRRSIIAGLGFPPDLAIFKSDYAPYALEENLKDLDGNAITTLEKEYKGICGCVEAKVVPSPSLFFDEKKYASRGLVNIKETTDKEYSTLASSLDGLSIKDKDLDEFRSELLWYRKVLYTDGIKWKFIELVTPPKEPPVAVPDDFDNNLVYVCEIGDLTDIFRGLVEEKPYLKTRKVYRIRFYSFDKAMKKINEECKNGWESEWNRLTGNLSKIEWTKSNIETKFKPKTKKNAKTTT